MHGDFASLAGNHTLAWRGADGATVQMRARFSLTFRRDHPDRPDNAWMIVEHFSSSMPTAPAEFKQVRLGCWSDAGTQSDLARVLAADLAQRLEDCGALWGWCSSGALWFRADRWLLLLFLRLLPLLLLLLTASVVVRIGRYPPGSFAFVRPHLYAVLLSRRVQ